MLKIINPATEEVIREVEEDNEDSIREKFLRSRQAQRKWRKVPFTEKLEIISNFRRLIVERKEHLAVVMTAEVGKPISQAHNELNGLLGRIDFFLEKTAETLAEETVFTDSGMTEKISHEPLGVIVNISAWNYPYFVGSNVFVPALLTGNSVLYKPSEFAVLTGLEITGLLAEAGLPEDVFLPVIGTGSVGAELLKQDINGVFFTGSYATGAKIAAAVSGRMIKGQFELGGKDPVYICEDVEIKNAAAAVADGAFYNTGQSCCAVERIYIHEKIYDQFVQSFLENVRSFVLGDPLDSATYIGAVSRRELHLASLENQVQDALAKGAKLLAGGKRADRKGFYFEPTVFSEVNHSMLLMKEETFGPIIGLQKVSGDEEAIALMNDTEYGLTAGVYTSNRERAVNILAEINSGSVYWNCCDRVSPRLPWSGRGHSGLGSTLSKYGILTFVQPKAWHLRG